MEEDLLAIQRLYPQVFHACHVRHTRSRRNPFGLSERDQSLLAHLSHREVRSAGELARHFGIGPSTLSEAMSRLEKLGYVERSRSPRDRRALALKLTRAGLEALAGTSVLDHDRLRAALEHLTAEERRTAVEGLELLARAARELSSRKRKGGER
jgi:DNA-binding MarR family transcriptional regulator